MKKKRGYVLLGLLLLFTVLGLSGSVGVLEQDTRLKRFKEEDLKTSLDTLRRGIDLFRYKFTVTNPNSAKVQLLEQALTSGIATQVINLLADESFIRARIATGPLKLRLVTNVLANASFEEDSGMAYPPVDGWTGNFTADDGVPDGWQLNSAGIEQLTRLPPGIYVASFWARAASATAKVHLRVWTGGGIPDLDLSGSNPDWKRHFGTFTLGATTTIRVEVIQNSGTSGDVAYIDGVMIEPWHPPEQAPASLTPGPSAWTASITIGPDSILPVLQRQHLEDLLPEGATAASMTYWFEW